MLIYSTEQERAILATRDHLLCPEGKWARVLDPVSAQV